MDVRTVGPEGLKADLLFLQQFDLVILHNVSAESVPREAHATLASAVTTLGTGLIDIDPKGTLLRPQERHDQTAYVGTGLRFYLSRRFFARAEYKWHVVFTSRDDNEEIQEWKAGFGFFF